MENNAALKATGVGRARMPKFTSQEDVARWISGAVSNVSQTYLQREPLYEHYRLSRHVKCGPAAALRNGSLCPNKKPGWCFWSTTESIRDEVPSATAILEAII